MIVKNTGHIDFIQHKWKWIGIAVLVKLLFYVYTMLLVYHGEKTYIPSADGSTYVAPSDNLVTSGLYRSKLNEPASFYRHPPGMALVYLPLRCILNQEQARWALVLLQTIIDGISVYFLALLSLYLFKRKRLAIMVYWLYLVSPYSTAFSPHLLSESLCISAFIFGLYFLSCYFIRLRPFHLIISSLCLLESFFLRPVMILAFIVCCMWLLYFLWKKLADEHRSIAFPTFISPLLSFSLPFVLCFCIWTAIVYSKSHEFHPQGTNNWVNPPKDKNDVSPTSVQFYAFFWVKSIGEDLIYYRPGTFGAWFIPNEMYYGDSYTIPAHIYTSHFHEKELAGLRTAFNTYWTITNGDSTASTGFVPIKGSIADSLGHHLQRAFLQNAAEYKREKPLRYYLIDPLSLTYHLLLNNGTHTLDWPPMSDMLHKYPLMLPLKLLTSISYLLILLCFMPAAVIMLLRRNMHYHWVLGITAALILFHSFYLRIIDERFVATAYPLMLLATAVLFSAISNLTKPEEETKFL